MSIFPQYKKLIISTEDINPDNLPVILSCGSAKIQTNTPIMAKDLYIGEYFKVLLKAAIRLSNRVHILSAGYGLMELNDLIETYDIKMTESRALWFRQNKIVDFPCLHMLSEIYLQALYTTAAIPLFDKSDGMGDRMGLAKKLREGKQPLISLKTLKPGIRRTLLSIP